MSAIGNLVFCDECNNLMTRTYHASTTSLKCEICGAESEDTVEKITTTQSKPGAFPSPLWVKRGVVQGVADDEKRQHTVTREFCGKCGETRDVEYFAQQLRGADEGSTISYTCRFCGHGWNVNN